MEIKFNTIDGKTLDLSGQKLSILENNSRMSDTQFTKFTFPFDFYMDENFKINFGDFSSDDSFQLKSLFDGYLTIENKTHQAKLKILSIDGEKINVQIDFGFEELPNFDKKLSELNLEKFLVNDIYAYAKTICNLTYPSVNFNFPRIHTKKYSPDTPVWDAFNGYYNDLKNDGSEMVRNYIDGAGNIFNSNIIHPLPHVLYLLKSCFEDANLQLSGDVLTEPLLQHRWVFSGTEYFSSLTQRRFAFKFTSAEINELDPDHPTLHNYFNKMCDYHKIITLDKPGIYKIAGFVRFWRAGSKPAQYFLKLNGAVIWEATETNMNSSHLEDFPINFNFSTNSNDSILEIYIYTQYHEDSWTTEMCDLLITSPILEEAQLTGEDNGVVTNLNKIDLSKAVPEMTVGEFVNGICNWFNYDMTVDGEKVWMNKINNIDTDDAVDFKKFENQNRKLNFLESRTFMLKPLDLDEKEKLNTMFISKDGPKLNKAEEKETIIIQHNGYGLPVRKAKEIAPLTAMVLADSTNAIQLVYYDGLIAGQNNAKNPDGLNFPELYYSHWENWIKQRINGKEYSWSFKCYPHQLDDITVKTQLLCYSNIHNIKNIQKSYENGIFDVEINTETVL